MNTTNTLLNEQEQATLQAQAYLLLQTGRSVEAYQLFKALCELEPNNHHLHMGLAVSALKAGEPAESLKLCQPLIEQEPWAKDPQAWLCFSRALWQLNQFEQARNAYAKFLTFKQTIVLESSNTAKN